MAGLHAAAEDDAIKVSEWGHTRVVAALLAGKDIGDRWFTGMHSSLHVGMSMPMQHSRNAKSASACCDLTTPCGALLCSPAHTSHSQSTHSPHAWTQWQRWVGDLTQQCCYSSS
jgi:hypothetical protein